MAGTSLYDDALAYDVLHAAGTAAEVRGLEAIERRFLPRRRGRRVWLEPACGTGRCLRAAARLGKTVVGFDLHPGMVAFARNRMPTAPARGSRTFTADMTSFSAHVAPGSIDLAFCLINTIRHLPTDAAMRAHLMQVRRALRPGGVYVVGMSLCAYRREHATEDVWTGARGRLRVTQVVQYEPPDPRHRAERVVSHLIIERPRGIEHRDAVYHLRSYNMRQWTRVVEAARMRVAASVDERGIDYPIREPGYHWLVLAAG